jgi:predicted Rossmann fold nucleotide-binding protein DprA/Smf involved in DNA uptake
MQGRKVAIVGSRDYKDLDDVRKYVSSLPKGTMVISGGAKGVDTAAAIAARERGLEKKEYLPQWHEYGKRAAFIRNTMIVKMSDEVVAFWDGKSKGTKMTIDIANKAGKPVRIIQCEENND